MNALLPTSASWSSGRHVRAEGGERGAVAPLAAILMPLFIFCTALALDVGVLWVRKAQLQGAVDMAALSAAEALVQPGVDPSSTARQVLGANGIDATDLVGWSVSFPQLNTVKVTASQRRPVYFLRAVSPIQQLTVTASATADVNAYAEVPIKPTGMFGKIQQVNPAIFGLDAWRSRGNAYSVRCTNNGSAGSCIPNPDYSKLPYGYLFRIDVPPTYAYSQVVVELFDPDSYNNPTYTGSGCANKEDTCVIANAFGPGWHRFYRVDELRSPYNSTASTCNMSGSAPLCSTWATTTQYTLWHFDPHITNAFLDPNSLSDVPTGTFVPGQKYIARATYGFDPTTDLKWVQPPGFTLNLSQFARERDGGWYFYLYVTTLSGSSENNFDIRTGPPGQVEETDVNDQQNHVWNSGGTAVYAKRAYPMNNTLAQQFTVYLTQVPVHAAGQTLEVRHFDNDCSSGCSIPYYLQKPDGSLVQIATGQLSGNDQWTSDFVPLPGPADPLFTQVFPPGTQSAWLRADYNVTFAQDTSVWELIYVRPRLIQ